MNLRLLVVLVVALAGPRLGAQSAFLDSLCNAADNAVEHVRLPAMNSGTAWDHWYRLSGCGMQGARAAAAALRTNELRTESDEARIDLFFQLFGGLRSNLLLNSYQDAAEDNAATVGIRLASIEAMSGLVSAATTYDRAALLSGPSGRCLSAPRAHPSTGTGTVNDLPNDVFGRVLNSVKRVANKAGATPSVQRLATCWQRYLELRAPVSTGQIQLSYVCGTKFKVQNGNTAIVKLQYVVVQTQGAGELTVLGKEALTFGVTYPGTVQLSYNGQVFATKANTNKVCP